MTKKCENCIHEKVCGVLFPNNCPFYCEEPKQGEWIEIYYDNMPRFWDCSVCKERNTFPSDFCPNCGADMRDKNELNRVSKELNSDNSTLLYSMTTGDNFIGKEGEAEC